MINDTLILAKNAIVSNIIERNQEIIKSSLKQKTIRPSLSFALIQINESDLSVSLKEIVIFLREILSRV